LTTPDRVYTIHNHNEDKRPRVHVNCCVKKSYQNTGPPRPAAPFPHCEVCGVTIYATAPTLMVSEVIMGMVDTKSNVYTWKAVTSWDFISLLL